MTNKQTIMVVIGALIAGIAIGAAGYLIRPSSIVVQSDKVDEARKAADTKEIAVVKEAMTKRRSAAKRVAQEVQHAITTSDLADYLGAHATSGGTAMGGSSDSGARDQGDGDALLVDRPTDRGDPVAPGAP